MAAKKRAAKRKTAKKRTASRGGHSTNRATKGYRPGIAGAKPKTQKQKSAAARKRNRARKASRAKSSIGKRAAHARLKARRLGGWADAKSGKNQVPLGILERRLTKLSNIVAKRQRAQRM